VSGLQTGFQDSECSEEFLGRKNGNSDESKLISSLNNFRKRLKKVKFFNVKIVDKAKLFKV
jgi:hypothetical protein